MKNVITICSMLLLAFALASCGGNTASNIEEYFTSHQDAYNDFMKGVDESAASYEGIQTDVTVTGNNINIALDISDIYKSVGITNSELAKMTFESAGTEAVEGQVGELQAALQQLESETGLTGIQIVYNFVYDGEKVFEFVVDKDGLVR